VPRHKVLSGASEVVRLAYFRAKIAASAPDTSWPNLAYRRSDRPASVGDRRRVIPEMTAIDPELPFDRARSTGRLQMYSGHPSFIAIRAAIPFSADFGAAALLASFHQNFNARSMYSAEHIGGLPTRTRLPTAIVRINMCAAAYSPRLPCWRG